VNAWVTASEYPKSSELKPGRGRGSAAEHEEERRRAREAASDPEGGREGEYLQIPSASSGTALGQEKTCLRSHTRGISQGRSLAGGLTKVCCRPCQLANEG